MFKPALTNLNDLITTVSCFLTQLSNHIDIILPDLSTEILLVFELSHFENPVESAAMVLSGRIEKKQQFSKPKASFKLACSLSFDFQLSDFMSGVFLQTWSR